ncbi:PEP-CTERM protein-sorting domain-containing protein [Duganella sp. CF458]|uniref:PEP-CTERM sorting domain-containing protein n=1 Tax=Duganella sp. CF458 TaxID=1884368 RepID=UPI0008F05FA6|nr:PEP-CTERM sorting domain-containing protein [Duganella sp. CF458]SFF91941.1 PEP-CTERM protein-sorting domain-containing protein [Duganella sp. CF458]
MKSLPRLFLLAILLLSGSSVRASLLSSISYFSCGTPCPTVVNSSAQDTSALGFSDQYGSIFAQAGYGVLKASVDSSFIGAPGGGFISMSTGSSLAQFSDTVTLGGLGGPHEITVVLHFEGTLGAAGEETQGTSASMTVSLTVDGHNTALIADFFGNLPELQASADGPALSATFTLDYGVPISLEALLQVSGTFGGFAHFGNTATLEFLVPEGTTILSGAGAEYLATAVAIPEPATFALLVLGLAALSATRNRYRHA